MSQHWFAQIFIIFLRLGNVIFLWLIKFEPCNWVPLLCYCRFQEFTSFSLMPWFRTHLSPLAYYPRQSGCADVLRCDLILNPCGENDECGPIKKPEERYRCHACSIRKPMPKQVSWSPCTHNHSTLHHAPCTIAPCTASHIWYRFFKSQ